jgi:hypothetical protein
LRSDCCYRCLPQDARKRWREIFYTRVWPEPIITEKETESCFVPVPKDYVGNEMISQELINNKTVSCEGIQDTPSLSENSKPNNDEDKDKPIRIYNLLETDRGQTATSLVSSEVVVSVEGGDLHNKNLTTIDKPFETQVPEETSKL